MVILTRDSAIDFLGEVTIAPVTTTIRDIPSEVYLDKSKDGMLQNCVVNLDHVQTVSKAKIGSLITSLSHQKMLELRSALLFSLGF